MKHPASTILRSLRSRKRVFAITCLILAVAFALVPSVETQTQSQVPDYKNPRLPVERRVADLLGRMTLEEKVAQLVCLWGGRPQVGPQTDFSTDRGDFSPEKAREVMKYGIGQIARQRERKDPREAARFANALQKWLGEKSPLRSPAIIAHGTPAGLRSSKGTSVTRPLPRTGSSDPE